jgi:FMN phosphatase YigB (HAD superfamily)
MTAQQLIENIDQLKKKNLIFDFMGVLFYLNHMQIIRKIGWFKFTLYTITTFENPIKRLKKLLFKFLGTMSKFSPHKKAQYEHVLLPDIMVAWLIGEVSGEDILKKINEIFTTSKKSIFKSKLEKDILHTIMQIIFNAQTLTEKIILPIEESIKLLQTLHTHTTKGQRTFKLYGLSNMDFSTYQELTKKYPALFDLLDGVIISAQVGSLKPDPEVYHHFLNTYKLNHADCMFFDDQIENVEGALKIGIEAIQFER